MFDFKPIKGGTQYHKQAKDLGVDPLIGSLVETEGEMSMKGFSGDAEN